MGNIFEAIKVLSLSSKVGKPGKLKSANGQVVYCITEAYSKNKNTATVSCDINGQKYLIELDLKPKNNNNAKDDTTEQSNCPSAVYTASGRLVYLAS